MKAKLNKYNKKDTRKVKVEIEKHDTWNLDHNLALIILPALLQLKNTSQGVPNDVASKVSGAPHDSQGSFDFYTDSYEESFDKAVNEWDNILDKMIWSFEQLAFRNWDDQYHHGEPKFAWQKTDDPPNLNPSTGKMEDVYQLVDLNPTEHWFDHVGAEKHKERIQEGLDLFAKYYMNLWD